MVLRSGEIENQVDRVIQQQLCDTLNLQSKLFSPSLGIRRLRVGAADDSQVREVLRSLYISRANETSSDNSNPNCTTHCLFCSQDCSTVLAACSGVMFPAAISAQASLNTRPVSGPSS